MTKPMKKMDCEAQEIGLINIPELIDAMRGNGDSVYPDPEMHLFYKMYNQRALWIDLEVSPSVLEYSRAILAWNMEDKGIPVEERKPITIFLHNYGGDADCAWEFIDVIETSATPIYTVNMGVAASAAALIFIAGKKRFMMPNAHVVIHEGAAKLSGDAVKVLDASDSYRKELKHMKDFILSHTDIPSSTLSRRKNNDWELDANACIEYSVCDKIITSLDEVL